MQVKALRQALKDVPSALDKNERFRRVSALVGGGHNKKDCYDKYKELKAEAKLKQNTLRTTSGVSTGSASCRDTFPTSAGSARLSKRGSTFSSWSSNSTDVYGQQQQQEEQQSRRSATSSTLSSLPPEDMDEVDHGVCDNKRAHQGISGTKSNGAGGVVTTRGGEGAPNKAREAVNSQELLEVEEIDIQEFCLDDELLVAEPHFAAGTAQTKARGNTGDYCRGRSSQTSSASARWGESGSGADQLIGRATVTEVEANGIRELVFGEPSKSFNDAWREQGFYFCGVDGLRYGLVQVEGGPCGVLAAVQAFLLEV